MTVIGNANLSIPIRHERIQTMDTLYNEAFAYLKHTWCENRQFVEVTKKNVTDAIQPYNVYLETLVPSNILFAKYIHKERMLYDLFIDDMILVFRYDTNDDDAESFYSESELSDDTSSETKTFINDVRLLDESDFREQITANEFTGGYWEPQHHWVLSKKMLRSVILEHS